jgi:hypothetical protein
LTLQWTSASAYDARSRAIKWVHSYFSNTFFPDTPNPARPLL